jgi:hypothetical protein
VPNPSNETAMLIANQTIKEILITDLCGRIVYQANNTGDLQQIKLPSFINSGLYIIEYSSNTGHGATRWLKN